MKNQKKLGGGGSGGGGGRVGLGGEGVRVDVNDELKFFGKIQKKKNFLGGGGQYGCLRRMGGFGFGGVGWGGSGWGGQGGCE